MAIKVAELGKRSQDLPFTPGRTAGDYLAEADMKVSDQQSLTINGRKGTPDMIPDDHTTVAVAPRIRNG